MVLKRIKWMVHLLVLWNYDKSCNDFWLVMKIMRQRVKMSLIEQYHTYRTVLTSLITFAHVSFILRTYVLYVHLRRFAPLFFFKLVTHTYGNFASKGEGAIRVAVITELLRSFYGASWYIGARLQLDWVETELNVLGLW